MFGLPLASPLQRVQSHLFADLEVWIKRDDLLHPMVSGNKYRKLKYCLPRPSDSSSLTVVSMGGPWSNHLHALAYACREMRLPSRALVRGLRKDTDPLTPTLLDCIEQGMQLQFVSREDYRLLRSSDSHWRHLIQAADDGFFWLPEGGSSPLALRGVSEILGEIKQELGTKPDLIVCACGTGATLAGIIAGLAGHGKVIGIAAVQNAHFLKNKVQDLLQEAGYPPYTNFEILTEYDHGGFAKTTPALLNFCLNFEHETGIPIEPVYTGKLFYAVAQLCQLKRFNKTQKIVLVHSGGLQGRRGFTSLGS